MSLTVDIEKRLGGFSLQLKLAVERGTLALLGPSGCGKTMTLKCIAGIERPDRGKIVLDGVTLFDSERHIDLPPQKRRTGLLFQNYALFPHMTVMQNICAGAGKAGRDRAQAVLERFELTELADRLPGQLSGGQQQRVALARILASEPEILLLDEPFSALDSHLRFHMEREVRQIIREFGKTVLLVSHDREEVFRMADQVAVMNNGRLDMLGPREQVFSHPETRTAAVLTGCRNLSAVREVAPGKFLAESWGVELKGTLPPGTAAVGIRARDLRYGPGPNAVRCRVAEALENPDGYTLMLTPVGAPSSAVLIWDVEKAAWQQNRAAQVEVHLPPEKLLFLKNG